MRTPFRLAIILLFTAAAAALGETKKTILDYYLDLPEQLFYCESKPAQITKEFKKKKIRKLNIRNGYILADSESSPLEVALFRDGRQGLTVIAASLECGEGCMCRFFHLYRADADGKLHPFDRFPSPDDIQKKIGKKDFYYELVLPEYGRDIKVIDPASKKTLCLITFGGGKFYIK